MVLDMKVEIFVVYFFIIYLYLLIEFFRFVLLIFVIDVIGCNNGGENFYEIFRCVGCLD